MPVQSKQELLAYALRKLGEPYAQVNVTEEQMQDRLDDALNKFRDFHYNGTQRMYLSHQVTEEDVQNGFIEVPDNIVSIVRVFPLIEGSASGSNSGDSGLFSVQYQVRMWDMWNVTSGTMSYYTEAMQYLSLMDQTFNGCPLFRHTQVVNKLYLDAPLGKSLNVGMYVAFECNVTADPDEYNKVWDDPWLKNYFTALVQRQWGENLRKFGNIVLMGGVSINSEEILVDANNKIAQLEDDLRNIYEEPIRFMIG